MGFCERGRRGHTCEDFIFCRRIRIDTRWERSARSSQHSSQTLFNASVLYTQYTENIHRCGENWFRPSKPCEKRFPCGIFSSIYDKVRRLSIDPSPVISTVDLEDTERNRELRDETF